MQCKNCSIVDVCEVANMISKYALKIDIDVTNCSIKNRQAAAPITQELITTTPAVVNPTMPFPQKVYKDFTAASNKMREEKAAPIETKVIKILPKEECKEPIKIKCPGCNANCLDTEISMCPDCGKPMCPSCSVTKPGDKKLGIPTTEVCYKCFDKR